VLRGMVRHTFIIFGLFTTPNLCPLTQNPGDATAYNQTFQLAGEGDTHSPLSNLSTPSAPRFTEPSDMIFCFWLLLFFVPSVVKILMVKNKC